MSKKYYSWRLTDPPESAASYQWIPQKGYLDYIVGLDTTDINNKHCHIIFLTHYKEATVRKHLSEAFPNLKKGNAGKSLKCNLDSSRIEEFYRYMCKPQHKFLLSFYPDEKLQQWRDDFLKYAPQLTKTKKISFSQSLASQLFESLLIEEKDKLKDYLNHENQIIDYIISYYRESDKHLPTKWFMTSLVLTLYDKISHHLWEQKTIEDYFFKECKSKITKYYSIGFNI